MTRILVIFSISAFLFACSGNSNEGDSRSDKKDNIHRAKTFRELIRGKWQMDDQPDLTIVITEKKYKEVRNGEVSLETTYGLYNDCDPKGQSKPSEYGNYMRLDMEDKVACNVIVQVFGQDSMHFFLHTGKLGKAYRLRSKED